MSLQAVTPRLVGTLISTGTLVGQISIKKHSPILQGYVSMPEKVVADPIETYTGEYTITPKVTEQEFDTRNKKMKSDLVVEEIPFYEVSNQSNGSTVIIGGK